MKKAAHLLRRFEFHLLLFFFGVVAFAKPTLIPSPDAAPTTLLLDHFVPWAVVIVLLAAIARSGPPGVDDDEDIAPEVSATPAPRD